jgi:hypothetical protein
VPGLVPSSRDIFARARESVHAAVGSAGWTWTRDAPQTLRVGTPAYKSMTIRSWATTLALLERMEAPETC